MKAELKDLYSLDFDLRSYLPEESDNFSFWLRAMIGPADQEGAESFDIHVCTPVWLKTNHNENDIFFGSCLLIVLRYDLDLIKSHIAKYCNSCSASNWQELAKKLSKIGQWEFDEYSPAPEISHQKEQVR